MLLLVELSKRELNIKNSTFSGFRGVKPFALDQCFESLLEIF